MKNDKKRSALCAGILASAVLVGAVFATGADEATDPGSAETGGRSPDHILVEPEGVASVAPRREELRRLHGRLIVFYDGAWVCYSTGEPIDERLAARAEPVRGEVAPPANAVPAAPVTVAVAPAWLTKRTRPADSTAMVEARPVVALFGR